MPGQRRINIRLIGAALCLLSALIILWRTFISPATSPLTPSATVQIAVNTGDGSNPEADFIPSPTLGLPSEGRATRIPPPTPRFSQNTPNPTMPDPAYSEPGTQQPAPTPSLVVSDTLQPTVIVEAATPTSVVAVQATAVPSTALPTNQPIAPTATLESATSSVPASATSQPVADTATPAQTDQTATPSPTPTETATISPSATPTPTPTPTQTGKTVLYEVVGAASNITIEYLDKDGVWQTIYNITLPWKLSFILDEEIGAEVTASSDDDDATEIKCSLSIDGTAQYSDTNYAYKGVTCSSLDQ